MQIIAQNFAVCGFYISLFHKQNIRRLAFGAAEPIRGISLNSRLMKLSTEYQAKPILSVLVGLRWPEVAVCA